MLASPFIGQLGELRLAGTLDLSSNDAVSALIDVINAAEELWWIEISGQVGSRPVLIKEGRDKNGASEF